MSKPTTENLLATFDWLVRLCDTDGLITGDGDRERIDAIRSLIERADDHEILRAENLARKKYIEELTACRDHWQASYEVLLRDYRTPPMSDKEPK